MEVVAGEGEEVEHSIPTSTPPNWRRAVTKLKIFLHPSSPNYRANKCLLLFTGWSSNFIHKVDRVKSILVFSKTYHNLEFCTTLLFYQTKISWCNFGMMIISLSKQGKIESSCPKGIIKLIKISHTPSIEPF